jgi:predicted Rossmann fold nucleotide-binding protein DprA/Smf involved in DNA uptake
MKWVAVSGSWRNTNQELEKNVRHKVREIIGNGKGLISGGALGVDYFVLDEVMHNDPNCQKIKVFLPAELSVFKKHFYQSAEKGVITQKQADKLINQLQALQKRNKEALIETPGVEELNKDAYYARNSKIIEAADQLIAFHVNNSSGVQDAINKAKQKGMPVKVFEYQI